MPDSKSAPSQDAIANPDRICGKRCGRAVRPTIASVSSAVHSTIVAPTFAEIAESEYILLTTFTKDGRPKPTAVWAARDGDRLLVITQESSWKVKRIRNTPRVKLAACDMRGRPKTAAIDATATVLDKSQNATVYAAIGKRYGIVGWVFNLFSKLRGGMVNNVGLELRSG